MELPVSSPIPRSFVASCVCFQLRPLSSTGVTRLHRYYDPLRHPTRTGLSLASCQLTRRAITAGTSRVAYGPLCLHAVAMSVSGPAQRSLTLRPARSPGRLRDPLHQGLQLSRCLHCSDCYRVEGISSRAGLFPLWTTVFSRRTRFRD